MRTQHYLGLIEVSRLVRVPFWRIIYAEQAGYLPEPLRVARKRAYTEHDIERIKGYFATKGNRRLLAEQPTTLTAGT